jgi:hypothetical protein
VQDYQPGPSRDSSSVFYIPSSRPGYHVVYAVDMDLGVCTCPRGMRRQLCKH